MGFFSGFGKALTWPWGHTSGGGAFKGPSQPISQLPAMDPQQQQLYTQALGTLSRYGRKGLPYGHGPWTPWAEEAYSFYKRPAERAFQESVLPAIRQGYNELGAFYGGQRQRAELRAGTELSEALGAKRYDFERQAYLDYLNTLPENRLQSIQLLLNALGMPTSQYMVTNQPAGLGYNLLSGMAAGAGQGAGMGLGMALMR